MELDHFELYDLKRDRDQKMNLAQNGTGALEGVECASW
jgi:hypothetical protein